MEKNFSLSITYSDSSLVNHGYIGLRARGRGFAELWSLKPAIENNVILEYKGENPSSIECPPGKCALAPHIPFERAHQMHQE
jgi:hypothetical protein